MHSRCCCADKCNYLLVLHSTLASLLKLSTNGSVYHQLTASLDRSRTTNLSLQICMQYLYNCTLDKTASYNACVHVESINTLANIDTIKAMIITSTSQAVINCCCWAIIPWWHHTYRNSTQLHANNNISTGQQNLHVNKKQWSAAGNLSCINSS